jgi:hypothetical protein
MNRRHICAVVVWLGIATVAIWASGQSGIYAVIEKVTVEPPTGPAERIQVWGAFAIMERDGQGFTSYVFRKPARGYMYFAVPAGANAENARREWKDLASLAGTKQAVAFGYWDQYRGDSMPTVRAADAKPANPDPYLTNVGLTKLNSTGNATVTELLKLIERDGLSSRRAP